MPPILPFMVEILLTGFALIAVVLSSFKRSLPAVQWILPSFVLILIGMMLPGPGSMVYRDSLSFLHKYLSTHGLSAMILITASLAVCQKQCRDEPISFAFILLSVLGLMTMVSANHLMALYVGIELATFPVLAWIALRQPKGWGLKYFGLSALASGMMLFGVALLFYKTQSLDYFSLYHVQKEGSSLGVIGICLLLLGIMFKMGVAPFHFWLPNVYQACTFQQAAYISLPMRIAAIGVLYLVCDPLRFRPGAWTYLLIASSLLSITVGVIGAFYQTNIKRLLAYTGINHMGFLIIGIFYSNLFVFVLPTYLIGYCISLMMVWSALISLNKEKESTIVHCTDLKGLAQTRPFHAGVLALAIVSMMGVPPLAVFWGKASVVYMLVSKGYLLPAIFVILMSVLNAFYGLRLLRYMYFSPVQGREILSSNVQVRQEISMIFSLIFLSLFLICISLILMS